MWKYFAVALLASTSGCAPQHPPSYYADKECFNKARLAVLNMPPSSYKTAALGGWARAIDEEEVQKRTYDQCTWSKKRS